MGILSLVGSLANIAANLAFAANQVVHAVLPFLPI